MTKRYMLCVGYKKPIPVIGKNMRSVINRHFAEPDTIAIVKSIHSIAYLLYRVDLSGRSELIGSIKEEEE